MYTTNLVSKLCYYRIMEQAQYSQKTDPRLYISVVTLSALDNTKTL